MGTVLVPFLVTHSLGLHITKHICPNPSDYPSTPVVKLNLGLKSIIPSLSNHYMSLQ